MKGHCAPKTKEQLKDLAKKLGFETPSAFGRYLVEKFVNENLDLLGSAEDESLG